MRIIFIIIQKEFRQILRDKFMRTAVVAMPILQMLVLVYAATFEIKQIRLFVLNHDQSPISYELEHAFKGPDFFKLTILSPAENQPEKYLKNGEAALVVYIPDGFEKELVRNQSTQVQLLVDAVDGMASQLATGYVQAVIQGFGQKIGSSIVPSGGTLLQIKTIKTTQQFWYNPLMDYKIYMAPGILVILVTAIGWFLGGMNMVREKESGTIEQLNVTPIRKYQFLLGKMIPFLIIGIFDLAFGLVVAKLLFHLPFVGSLFTLFVFTVIYLITILGMGLFFSTISNTQQQVLFVSFFFIMTFVLMSGLFTPTENMPKWGQWINTLNPLAYFARVIRMVLLKGSTLADIRHELWIMAGYAIAINSLALWFYRKTS